MGGQIGSLVGLFGRDINQRGQIVGWSTDLGREHALLWEAGTGTRDLGTLGGCCSFAISINERGHIVGDSGTITFKIHGFLWESGRSMRDLGSPTGGFSSARGINARGQIVGGCETAPHRVNACLWESNYRE
jgi:probable HAF family extracellular repeat protein